eukprot:COSAG05_NODE_1243_length_5412_cov_2.064510_2_plen_107_part_00
MYYRLLPLVQPVGPMRSSSDAGNCTAVLDLASTGRILQLLLVAVHVFSQITVGSKKASDLARAQLLVGSIPAKYLVLTYLQQAGSGILSVEKPGVSTAHVRRDLRK